MPNKRLLQSRQTLGSCASPAVTTLAAQQNRRDVRHRGGPRGIRSSRLAVGGVGDGLVGASEQLECFLGGESRAADFFGFQ